MKTKNAAALFFLMIATDAMAGITSTVLDIPIPGGTQRILYVRPDLPVANIVSIAGGDGVYGIQSNGIATGTNAACGPVMRNRLALAERGFAVAFVDKNSLGAVYRVDDILAVIRYVRLRDDVPTW